MLAALRALFWPLPDEPRVSPEMQRRYNVALVALACGAIVIDLAIVLLLRDARWFDTRGVDAFAAINLPLIAGATALSLFGVRRADLEWPLDCTAAVIAVTCAVFIQVTGTVSSYFLFAGPFLIVIYRLFLDYRRGAIAAATFMGAHAAAFALEEAGLLRPASLFVQRIDTIYAHPTFRLIALGSFQTGCAFAFAMANIWGHRLRAADRALSSANRHFEQAVVECVPGRLVGRPLGPYLLEELLGRGGMGEVYQARRTDDPRSVAIKVLYSHLGEDPDCVARFRREIQAVSRVPSPFVPAVLDFGQTPDGVLYLVMELLHGEDLGTLLRRRGRLPLAEAVALAEQLGVALAAAHRAGVVHRDLKPQNVFLAASPGGAPAVKLLDFGVSRLAEATTQLTRTAAIVGTPGYLAPEQVAPQLGEITAQTDVFALGLVIYRMLTGQNAFLARGAVASAYEAVHVDPLPPTRLAPELPPDLDAVLALALAKRPAERYADAMELVRDLHAAAQGALPEPVRRRARSLGGTGGPAEATLPG